MKALVCSIPMKSTTSSVSSSSFLTKEEPSILRTFESHSAITSVNRTGLNRSRLSVVSGTASGFPKAHNNNSRSSIDSSTRRAQISLPTYLRRPHWEGPRGRLRGECSTIRAGLIPNRPNRCHVTKEDPGHLPPFVNLRHACRSELVMDWKFPDCESEPICARHEFPPKALFHSTEFLRHFLGHRFAHQHVGATRIVDWHAKNRLVNQKEEP